MSIKSIAVVLGSAIAAALLVACFYPTLGIPVFLGVAVSMGLGEYREHRRLIKVAAHLAKNEKDLTEIVQVMNQTLAVAQATGDRAVIDKASQALASAQNVLNEIRELKTQVA